MQTTLQPKSGRQKELELLLMAAVAEKTAAFEKMPAVEVVASLTVIPVVAVGALAAQF